MQTQNSITIEYKNVDQFIRMVESLNREIPIIGLMSEVYFDSELELNMWHSDRELHEMIILKSILVPGNESKTYDIYTGVNVGTLHVYKSHTKIKISSPLISLDDFNKKEREKYNKESNLNGIACPKCGEELMDSSSSVLLSHPPQKRVNCSKCDFVGTRIK